MIAVVLSLAGTVLCISLALWVVPHYRLPDYMYALILLAYAALLGVAWVPMTERPGEHSYRHGHFLSGSVRPPSGALASVTSMVLAIGWPLLLVEPARRAFLVLESLIAVSFAVAVSLLFVG